MPEARAQEPKVQDEVKAKSFAVVDEAGNLRIRMGVDKGILGKDDTASIAIYGSPDKKALPPLLILTAGREDSGLTMTGGSNFGAMLNSHKDGHSTFRMGKNGDSPFVALLIEEDGSPSVVVSDGRADRAVMGVTRLDAIKTGEKTTTAPSSLNLFDRAGKIIWQAP